MIDEALLKRVAADLPNPIYYVAGPPAMVAAVREALERAGVDGDDVRTEEFYGY
jgi:ferredoxin-NADP reductase